jgi:dTDP-4-amino-4,6-dideoxygalactose transaminase
MNENIISVTKTFFPPLVEYNKYLERIWKNQWLTNRGELVVELEAKLKEYLAVPNIIVMNNGTIPLQFAIKVLANGGEIITTPFSYVATTAAIVWQNCTPVFVDIHPEYLTIDESKIEAAITSKTTAILATHVFGNPCNVEAIEKIAKKYQLKVIYDAAHCFGVNYNGSSIFNYGDASTCSFHATKLFHTGEGGAIFSTDDELLKQLFYSHNFGHKTQLDFHGLGINGKISELQAAMGLSVFPYMSFIINERKKVVEHYENFLDFSKLDKIKIRENTDWNYSYYPVLFRDEATLLSIEAELLAEDIVARRYFYPSLNNLPYCQNVKMPISDSVAERVLCLPLFVGLETKYIERIVKVINDNL